MAPSKVFSRTVISLALFISLMISSADAFHKTFASHKSPFSLQMKSTFHDLPDYINYLQSIAQVPKGFSIGATRFNFEPIEVKNKILPMNLTLISLDKPSTAFAAQFTSNLFPGGPVLVGKDRMKDSAEISAIVVNNKISNVCPASDTSDRGYSDSDKVCDSVSSELGLPSKAYVFPSSTGIIGWKLPVRDISNALPSLKKTLQKESLLPAALGIMTTDRYPKLRTYLSPSGWRISGAL